MVLAVLAVDIMELNTLMLDGMEEMVKVQKLLCTLILRLHLLISVINKMVVPQVVPQVAVEEEAVDSVQMQQVLVELVDLVELGITIQDLVLVVKLVDLLVQQHFLNL